MIRPVLLRAIKEATYILTDVSCLFNYDGLTIISDDIFEEFEISPDNITVTIYERYSGEIIGVKQFVDYQYKKFNELVDWIVSI